jgi:phage/plasmid-like protein (TIGR03299 family)
MKLGKLVDEPKTAAEAAKLSGLDFTVSLCEVAYLASNTGDWDMLNQINPIKNRRAVVADDNGDFMGFVSSNAYNPLQYVEAFDFMDALDAPYVAAGSLRKRRQGFMVVKPDIKFNVLGGDDPHDIYTVLRTSHDCSRGIEVSVMPLRHRCMNQLTLRSFAKGVDYRWSIKHTSTMTAKLKDAQASLSKIGVYVKRYEAIVEKLVDIEIKPDKGLQVLRYVIPEPTTGKTDRTHEQWQDRLNTIMELWQTAPTVAYAGTGWGLVNAVSEFYDWGRAGGTPESRFLNALEGETHKKINQVAGRILAGV